jgi:hypothetical protein
MAIRLGVIEYDRPSRPVDLDAVRELLAVGGKDIVRVAWASLAPDEHNWILKEALAVWLREFFNLRTEAVGMECIKLLLKMSILSENWATVRPGFDI